jgi:hypothetical protein
MPEPKHKRSDEPEPPEAGLQGPIYDGPVDDAEMGADEYLLLKVVQANGEHLRTMRWGLGLGTLLLLFQASFGGLLAANVGPLVAGLVVFAPAGLLLGAGLHALSRQLELLRRAVAATDHFVFGPGEQD